MSIFSQPISKYKPSRNGFDLSKRNVFSANCGMLLPIYNKYVLPGDKFRLNCATLTRTLPLNTDAFARIREYVDFFFVPYRLIYDKFPEWVIQNNKPLDVNLYGDPSSNSGMLPYLDFNNILDNSLQINQDWSSDVVDDLGFSYYDGAYRLMDYLGYGQYYKCGFEDSGTNSLVPPSYPQNPWAACVYQKIYADFYRNTEWEDEDLASYNLNSFYGLQSPDINYRGQGRAWNLFKMRYANYKKDILMSVHPSTQFGSVSVVPLNSGNPFYVKTSEVSTNQSAYITSAGNLGINGSGKQFTLTSGLNSSEQVGISVLDIRQAQALQRWKEVTMLNGFRYNEQIEAHFGFRVPDGRAQVAEFIDGWSNTISISEVVNTAENQGNITGKGVGVNDSHTIEYDVKEHGMIMAIYHIAPDLDYNQSRAKEDNTMLDPEDYFIPEYENVGLGDIQKFNYSYGVADQSQMQAINEVIGNQIRYAHMKSDIDECHGAFAAQSTTDDLKKWVIPVDSDVIRHFLDLSQGSDVDYRLFKVLPSACDNLFSQSSTASENTDKFLCNFYFDTKAVRSMSVDGMPY